MLQMELERNSIQDLLAIVIFYFYLSFFGCKESYEFKE